MMRVMLAAALLLAGCDGDGAAGTGDRPAPAPPRQDEPPVALGWSAGEVAGGFALDWLDEDGVTMLTLRCLGDPPVFEARLHAIEPIASEERLSLGLGDEIVTMVADTSDGSDGTAATTHDAAAIAAPLRAAGTISASYGARAFGPVAAPDAGKVEALIASCGG